MDEAPIRPIEKKNDATKRTRVCFTLIASFIFGEGRHLREAHGNIKACHQRAADHMEQLRISAYRWELGRTADETRDCNHAVTRSQRRPRLSAFGQSWILARDR